MKFLRPDHSLFPRMLSCSLLIFSGLSLAQSNEQSTLSTLLPNTEISGDGRLRYEYNSSTDTVRTRNRGVLRARIKVTQKLNDNLVAAIRITTGDKNDPNSTDVTMGNYGDSLELSLDQAYLTHKWTDFAISAGKIENPFVKTDLIWDGDVNPFGASFTGSLYRGQSLNFDSSFLATIIDEQTSLDDSSMFGGQFRLSSEFSTLPSWLFSASYYDYSLGALDGADAGDTRDNYLTEDNSEYLSDFNLMDFIFRFSLKVSEGADPFVFTSNYVKNLGANTNEDTGYAIGVAWGDLTNIKDWKASYFYFENETDAVFTAFSPDNIPYASNYKLHALSIDHKLDRLVTLNLTAYLYSRNRFHYNYTDNWDDSIWRARFNVSIAF